MKKLLSVILLMVLLMMNSGTASAEIKATVKLPNLNIGDHSNFDVSILVSTDSLIGVAQFVMEYNSNLMTYVSCRLGANAPSGFSISNVNPNLPFNPTTPGTNENILVQLSGGGSKSFSGSDREIVVIEFQLVGNFGESCPLAFDTGTNKTYLSTIKLNDIAGSSLQFINGSVNYSVPVELSSFYISTASKKVILSWSTASETNNFGFEIQRKQEGADFNKIGFMPGKGTTTSLNNYSYTDGDLPGGTYYYRLKQIDNDGAFKFSEIKSVALAAPLKYNLEQNYPNPFNSATVIRYQISQQATEPEAVELLIYNLLGELVRTLLKENQGAGEYSVVWDGCDNWGNMASSGIYIARLITKNHVLNLKMLYLR